MKRLLLLVLLILTITSGCYNRSEINLYVSPLGSNENPGTKEFPIKSLGKALEGTKTIRKNTI
jgi:hypothetical protein